MINNVSLIADDVRRTVIRLADTPDGRQEIKELLEVKSRFPDQSITNCALIRNEEQRRGVRMTRLKTVEQWRNLDGQQSIAPIKGAAPLLLVREEKVPVYALDYNGNAQLDEQGNRVPLCGPDGKQLVAVAHVENRVYDIEQTNARQVLPNIAFPQVAKLDENVVAVVADRLNQTQEFRVSQHHLTDTAISAMSGKVADLFGKGEAAIEYSAKERSVRVNRRECKAPEDGLAAIFTGAGAAQGMTEPAARVYAALMTAQFGGKFRLPQSELSALAESPVRMYSQLEHVFRRVEANTAALDVVQVQAEAREREQAIAAEAALAAKEATQQDVAAPEEEKSEVSQMKFEAR